jgi:predicted DNA-binding transcriptional regulator
VDGVHMTIKEEIKTSKFDKAKSVIIVDETPDEWRLWRAFTRVFTRHNDLAFKIYAVLLERKKTMDVRDIATVVHNPRYSVDNALQDLHELGLVFHERHKKGNATFDYWRVETPVIGVLRLIPKKYFRTGYPQTTI